MRKKLLSLSLTLALCLGLAIPAFAANPVTLNAFGKYIQISDVTEIVSSDYILDPTEYYLAPDATITFTTGELDEWEVEEIKEHENLGPMTASVWLWIEWDEGYVDLRGSDFELDKAYTLEDLNRIVREASSSGEVPMSSEDTIDFIRVTVDYSFRESGGGSGGSVELGMLKFDAAPAEGTDPVEPEQPTDPVEPVEPTDPVEPVEPTDPAATDFTDVSDGDYFAAPVRWAVANNITSGMGDGSFGAANTCSRAQILTFLYAAAGRPEPTAENPFADVKDTDYFYKPALWAAEKGLVSGDTFAADTPCTRASTMEYLWKSAGSPEAAYDDRFEDVAADADYAQAVAWAVENGVTAGVGEGAFGSEATCTRGQIMTFLYVVYGK